MSYDNEKQVIVSKVVSDNDKAPQLRVNIELDGVKYKAGLWVWTRKADGSKVLDKAGNAQYMGTLELDDYVAGQGSGQQGGPMRDEPPADDFDDLIPF